MGRQLVEVEHAIVVEPGDIVESGDRWLRGAGADVEEHLLSGQRAIADGDLERRAGPTGEAGLAVQQRQAVGVPERLGLSVHPPVDQRVLAGHHGGEVDGDLAGEHAVARGGPREVRHPRRRAQRLGRTTAPIEARATDPVRLDERHLPTGRPQGGGPGPGRPGRRRSRWRRTPSIWYLSGPSSASSSSACHRARPSLLTIGKPAAHPLP